MSGNEISTPVSLGDAIRDRVRKTLFDSIPDEQIDTLIKKEWDAFFRAPQSHGYHQTPSNFASMVAKEITSQLEARVKAAVSREISVMYSEDGDPQIIGAIIQKMTPGILEAIIGGAAARTLAALKAGV